MIHASDMIRINIKYTSAHIHQKRNVRAVNKQPNISYKNDSEHGVAAAVPPDVWLTVSRNRAVFLLNWTQTCTE